MLKSNLRTNKSGYQTASLLLVFASPLLFSNLRDYQDLVEFLPHTGPQHRSGKANSDTHHLTGLGTTAIIPVKFGFKCFTSLFLPSLHTHSPPPLPQTVQTVPAVRTSELWGKNLSVKEWEWLIFWAALTRGHRHYAAFKLCFCKRKRAVTALVPSWCRSTSQSRSLQMATACSF